MADILMSIQPIWCYKIISGEKTVEIRKSKPRQNTPFRCYIYQTLPKYGDWNERDGRVIGEFVCNRIFDVYICSGAADLKGHPFPGAGMTDREIANYLGSGKSGYGWRISKLKVYEKPKPLSAFGLKRAPQSWCYVHLKENALVIMDDYGMTKCGSCGAEIVCNDCGDMPDTCYRCGKELDYTKIN